MKGNILAETPLRRSAAIQLRVISALVRREILTRYGRHNIGFMWLFVEPMMFTLGVTAMWTMTKATHGSTLPIVSFAVTGYSSVLMWRNASNRCGKAIEPNLSLLYHRNVRVIDIFASRIILEVAGATISMVVISLGFIAAGVMPPPADILTMIAAWGLLSWFVVGLGLIIGAVSERSDAFERIWHTITYFMFPLSGAVFMVDWLPNFAKSILLWVPMVHATEMLRHGYYGSLVRTYENPAYIALVSAVMTLIGLALARETGRRVEPQ